MGIEGSDPLARCRADMAAMLAAWRAVARRSAPAARAEAEAQVFAQMVVALDRRLEGGAPSHGPRAEVHHLAQGVTDHAGWFLPQGAWQPQGSVTGYATGDRIRLTEAVFARLLSACLPALTPA